MNHYILALTLYLLVASARAQTDASTAAAHNPRLENATPLIIRSNVQLQGTVPVMFATLVREFGMSGGVAVSNQDCSHGPEGSASISAGTNFNAALTQVARGTILEGQILDGVANLLPASGPPPLLQVWVPKFEWDRTTPAGEVIERLRQLPEVSAEAGKLGLQEAPLEGGMSAVCLGGDCKKKPKAAPILETEEGETLLTLLNRIVQAHRGSVWGYSAYRCGKGTLFSLEVLAE